MDQKPKNPHEIIVKGKTYKLRPFDPAMLGKMVKWASARLPDPLAVIKDKLKDFSPALQEVMVREAMREARTPKTLTDPAIQAELLSEEGLLFQLTLTFGDDVPDLWQVHLDAIDEHGQNYLQKLYSI